jgi:hypothetical protein
MGVGLWIYVESLVDLIGVLTECMFKKEISKDISYFETYLGTLEPDLPRDLCV